MVSAALQAYRHTSDTYWYEQASRAFDWFLGWNDLGLELYSSTTGGCCDALHVDRVNQNQGAESTVSFLLALAEMKLVEAAVSTFNQPVEPVELYAVRPYPRGPGTGGSACRQRRTFVICFAVAVPYIRAHAPGR